MATLKAKFGSSSEIFVAAMLTFIFAALLASCRVSLAEGNGFKLDPSAVTLILRNQQQFQIAAKGDQGPSSDGQIRWAVNGILGGNDQIGTISMKGLYIAPKENPSVSIQISAMYTSGRASARASVSLIVDPALPEAHDHWISGVTAAAATFGCSDVAVQQRPEETVEDALKLFAQIAGKKSCLALYPVSTDPESIRYSFAWGGKVDDVDVYYISDVSRLRIWNASPVTSN